MFEILRGRKRTPKWQIGVFGAFVLWLSAHSASGGGQSVSLLWEPSPSSTVAGYKVYYGTASGVYTSKRNVGNVTSVTFSNLAAGMTYYFAVSVFDPSGLESGLSNEVSYTVPGFVLLMEKKALNGYRFIAIKGRGIPPPQWQLEWSRDLTRWTPYARASNSPVDLLVLDVDLRSMYFRLSTP